jgi:hypothetical protein
VDQVSQHSKLYTAHGAMGLTPDRNPQIDEQHTGEQFYRLEGLGLGQLVGDALHPTDLG